MTTRTALSTLLVIGTAFAVACTSGGAKPVADEGGARDVTPDIDEADAFDGNESADPSDCTPVCGEMAEVGGGLFWQGCNAAVDSGCKPNESPYHQVSVPTFWIDVYEVTVDEYRSCVSAGGCTASKGIKSSCNQGKAGKGDHPMNCITWYQAGEYCRWAGKRLCSESEWEKASRGTDGRIYPWGNEAATCQYAVMEEGGRGCGTESTSPVGSKPAGVSPYGALDMSGNVWEWVEDDWHPTYADAPTDGSAWVYSPRTGLGIGRGGGFSSGIDRYLRSSCRESGDPADEYDVVDIGVRCCRSRHSHAETTPLVVRDSATVHNPVAALYQSQGRFRDRFFGG